MNDTDDYVEPIDIRDPTDDEVNSARFIVNQLMSIRGGKLEDIIDRRVKFTAIMIRDMNRTIDEYKTLVNNLNHHRDYMKRYMVKRRKNKI